MDSCCRQIFAHVSKAIAEHFIFVAFNLNYAEPR